MSLNRATRIEHKDNKITLFTWHIEEVTEFREKYQDTHDVESPSILGEFLGKDKTSYYITATKKPVVIPQQSMSKTVKKKFTELEERIHRVDINELRIKQINDSLEKINDKIERLTK